MLDPVKAGEQRLAGVENLEMGGARDVVRVAHLDHRLRAGQRQPEVDLERGRAPLDVALGQTSRLVCIASDDGVVGVGRVVAVDVRAAGEDVRPLQAVGGDHLSERHELVVPLSGIAEGGDAVTQLPERQLRVVLDVEMQVDQAGHDRSAAEIDMLSSVGRRRARQRPNRRDAAIRDDDARNRDGRRAGAVDDLRAVEHEHRIGRTARCLERER